MVSPHPGVQQQPRRAFEETEDYRAIYPRTCLTVVVDNTGKHFVNNELKLELRSGSKSCLSRKKIEHYLPFFDDSELISPPGTKNLFVMKAPFLLIFLGRTDP